MATKTNVVIYDLLSGAQRTVWGKVVGLIKTKLTNFPGVVLNLMHLVFFFLR